MCCHSCYDVPFGNVSAELSMFLKTYFSPQREHIWDRHTCCPLLAGKTGGNDYKGTYRDYGIKSPVFTGQMGLCSSELRRKAPAEEDINGSLDKVAKAACR